MTDAPKYNGWLAAGIFNGLQKISVPVFGIITTILLAKKALTKQEMGVWALFLVITSFIELIRQALVKTSMIRFVNHSEAHEHKYVLSAALTLNIIVTAILSGVLFFTAHFFSHLLEAPQLEQMLHFNFIGMILLVPFSHFEWIMYSKSQFRSLFWTFFFRQGVSLLLIIIFLLANGKVTLNELVLFYSAGILAGAVAGYRLVHQFITKTFTFSKEWTAKLWHFGKYVFGSGVSTIVFANAGQMMLSPIMGSTLFTASQSIAARVINLADMPSQVLSDLLFPKSARKENAESKERIKYYYEKTVGATLCFAIPLVVFILLFPQFIIAVLAGKQYYDAIPYLQLISFTALSLAFLKHWGVIIDSTGKPGLNFFIVTLLALLHVVLAFIFIKSFGFLGAAYALLITHAAGIILIQIILKRLFNISFFNCFKEAFYFYPELTKLFLHKISIQWSRK